MDLTATRSLLDKDLDQLLAKASDPKATLSALARKITATVESVEAHVLALDERATALPDELGREQAMIGKVEAVVAKAEQEGRADLASAARQRLDKHMGQVTAIQRELAKNDADRAEAEDLLVKLEERLVEIDARGVEFGGVDTFSPEPIAEDAPAPGKPAPAPAAPPSKPATPAAAAPAKHATPAAAAPAKPAAPAAAAPAKPATPAAGAPAKKGGGDLDDEFAALLSDMNVDLSKVELPNRKKPALPATKDDDLGLPELVTVADNELPEGEELEPLPDPKKGGKPAAGPAKAAAPGKPAAAAPAKPAAAAPGKPAAAAAPAKAAVVAAKPGAPATADAPAKKSKLWLWLTLGTTAVGAGGLAVAHFVFGVF